MRILLQRVTEAWVEIAGVATPRAGAGLVALVGFGQGDHESLLQPMAAKLVQLRVFEDEAGLMNRSLVDCKGDLVVVSQFTLYADCRKGRRPGFGDALAPGLAEGLFMKFGEACRKWVPELIMGRFGATMQVHLVNDGPVTLMLDSADLNLGRVQP